jgi:hypothetical protein
MNDAKETEENGRSTDKKVKVKGVVVAIYNHTGTGAVRGAVANAAKTSVAEIDGNSVKELKAGLAEAQARLAG